MSGNLFGQTTGGIFPIESTSILEYRPTTDQIGAWLQGYLDKMVAESIKRAALTNQNGGHIEPLKQFKIIKCFAVPIVDSNRNPIDVPTIVVLPSPAVLANYQPPRQRRDDASPFGPQFYCGEQNENGKAVLKREYWAFFRQFLYSDYNRAEITRNLSAVNRGGKDRYIKGNVEVQRNNNRESIDFTNRQLIDVISKPRWRKPEPGRVQNGVYDENQDYVLIGLDTIEILKHFLMPAGEHISPRDVEVKAFGIVPIAGTGNTEIRVRRRLLKRDNANVDRNANDVKKWLS